MMQLSFYRCWSVIVARKWMPHKTELPHTFLISRNVDGDRPSHSLCPPKSLMKENVLPIRYEIITHND